MGIFSGPRLKIFADKNSNSGQMSLTIKKTSSVGSGQRVIKSGITIDLYSPSDQSDQEVYFLDLEKEENEDYTYEELYNDFSFELELLPTKNQSSKGNQCILKKYSFSKRHFIQIQEEEFDSAISFKSSGGVR